MHGYVAMSHNEPGYDNVIVERQIFSPRKIKSIFHEQIFFC